MNNYSNILVRYDLTSVMQPISLVHDSAQKFGGINRFVVSRPSVASNDYPECDGVQFDRFSCECFARILY